MFKRIDHLKAEPSPPKNAAPNVATALQDLLGELSMLSFESQQAIWLRTIKLCMGGTAAGTEAVLMVTEKVNAAQTALANFVAGSPAIGIVRDYRSAVQSNVLRLSRPHDPLSEGA